MLVGIRDISELFFMLNIERGRERAPLKKRESVDELTHKIVSVRMDLLAWS